MMEAYITLLREKGCKITPQRRAVLQALLECENFPTAQQVLDYVKKINPDTGLDTVYRNLNMLAEMGVVNQIHIPGRDGNVFEISTDQHHHHLVCLGCGKMECLDYCPVIQEAIPVGSGFKVVSHSLDFYGYCLNCGAGK